MGTKNRKKQAALKMDRRMRYWLIRIMRLACSAVEWKGLPEYLDLVLMENILNSSGSAIIGYDEDMEMFVMGQNASYGKLDINGYPMQRKAMFQNGMSMRFDTDTSVIIYNNSMRTSDLFIFKDIAYRMADFDCAIDINVNTQKTMPIIPTNQNQVITITNMYESMVNNLPYLLVEDNMGRDTEIFKNAILFDNAKSFTADKIIAVQREIWNRCLTLIGVNNVNVEKKERTNVPEINSNLDEIYLMRRDRLNSREKAAKQMSLLFGLDISVDYYNAMRKTDKGIESPLPMAGVGGALSNGGIYDASKDNSGADMAQSTSGDD